MRNQIYGLDAAKLFLSLRRFDFMKTTSTKKQVVYLTLVLCLTGLLPAPVVAWGPEGHHIVARLAQKRLSATARRKIAGLLNGGTLESVATYADDRRPFRPETELWHFVDIPRSGSTYDPARDCTCTRRGDCVIAAIEQFKVILADPNEKPARRTEALKFIVHFVGDLHQPLHCADDHDRGGNDVKVTFFGTKTNLHHVWDTSLIERTGLTETNYVRKLNAALATQDIAALQNGTTIDWAVESHQAAVDHSYNIPATKILGDQYFQDNRPIVDDRLARAGVRLARILNQALQ
jgi:hypothetical protein